jgi:hypothetical protein
MVIDGDGHCNEPRDLFDWHYLMRHLNGPTRL